MDKRMINIDDLVRQRLEGVEEGGERTGAWLKMSELLDSNMPVNNPGAAFNWRRTFSYLAGLLLLATVSVGGYEAATSRNREAKENGPVMDAPARHGLSSSLNYINNKSNNNNNNNNADGRLALVTATDKNEHNKQCTATAHIAKTTKTDNMRETAKAATGSIAALNTKALNKHNNNNNRKHTNTPLVAVATSHNATAPSAVHKSIAPAAASAHHATTSIHRLANMKKNTGIAVNTKTANAKQLASVALKKKAYHANTLTASAHSNSNADNIVEDKAISGHAYAANKQTGNNNDTKDKIAGNIEINANTLPGAQNKVKDSIDVLKIEDHYHKVQGSLTGAYSHDTTSEERIAAAARLSAAKQAAASATRVAAPVVNPPRSLIASAKPVGSANNNSRYAPASGSVVPQSASAASASITATKKKSTGLSMADKIEEALSATKQNINGARFTPGLLAGVNSTFGSNSFGGFHLGISGELTLNNKWSLMAELRYLHQFTGNTAINDNYSTYTVPQPNTWERDSVMHSFNFSTLHSIDLPISIRYKTGNFMIFLGGELVYNFSINYNESIGGIKGQLNSGAEPYIPANTAQKPFIDNTDFVARFGAGYLFGVGYQLTSQFDISLRMMQTVWDNSKSASQKSISNDFYKNPSIQLSIGYKLNDSRTAK